MPVDLFHGTSEEFAASILGPPRAVDVGRGSGEFGTGFYAGTSKGFALAWVVNRFSRPAVLALAFEADAYATLDVKELDVTQAEALRKLARKNKGEQLTGHDVVVGPVEANRRNAQHKFETPAAQAMLNGALATIARIA